MERSPVDKDPDFEQGVHDGDLYDDKERQEEMYADEISDVEEGFVEGYEHGEHQSSCANCRQELVEDFVEEEFNGHTYRFCSTECALEYEKKH